MIILIPVLLSGFALWRIVEKNALRLKVFHDEAQEITKNNKKSLLIWVIFIGLAVLLLLIYGSAVRAALMPRYGAGTPRFPVPGMGKSMIVTGGYLALTVGIQTLISWLGGYGLGMFRWRGRKIISAAMHITAFITPAVLSTPFIIPAARLKLFGTIVPAFAVWLGMPLGTVLFKMYYKGIREAGTEKGGRRDGFFMVLFVVAVFLLLQLNSLFAPLIFGKAGETFLLSSFLYRITFSFQPYIAADITAFALLIYTPWVILIAALLMILGRYFFSRVKILGSAKGSS